MINKQEIMKKTYITPATAVLAFEGQQLMVGSAQTVLDPTKDDQWIKPVDDEYNDDFMSRRRNNGVWGDDEEEEL